MGVDVGKVCKRNVRVCRLMDEEQEGSMGCVRVRGRWENEHGGREERAGVAVMDRPGQRDVG